MRAIMILLLMVSSLAHTREPVTIWYGGWSKHLVSNDHGDAPWNETHNALGVEYKQVSVINFTNSFGEDAWGIGYDYDWKKYKYVDISLYGALWSGYEALPYDIKGVIPIITPKITFKPTKKTEIYLFANPVVCVLALGRKF